MTGATRSHTTFWLLISRNNKQQKLCYFRNWEKNPKTAKVDPTEKELLKDSKETSENISI